MDNNAKRGTQDEDDRASKRAPRRTNGDGDENENENEDDEVMVLVAEDEDTAMPCGTELSCANSTPRDCFENTPCQGPIHPPSTV